PRAERNRDRRRAETGRARRDVMATLAELEAALAASFDREHLAVYGDYLQSIGDPRGELIAIDLQGGDPARKRELVRAWLGNEVAMCVQLAGELQLGFVALRVRGDGELAAARRVLASAAGTYLHSLTIESADVANEIIAAVNAAPRPWLR